LLLGCGELGCQFCHYGVTDVLADTDAVSLGRAGEVLLIVLEPRIAKSLAGDLLAFVQMVDITITLIFCCGELGEEVIDVTSRSSK
jgi:hypothetical protein